MLFRSQVGEILTAIGGVLLPLGTDPLWPQEDIPWMHVDLSACENEGGLAHVSTKETGFGARFTLILFPYEVT